MAEEMVEAQTDYLSSLRVQVGQRTPLSGALWGQSQCLYPRGEISAARKFDPWPFYAVRGEGPYIWDFDGNRYIDCCMCYGVLLLGHAPAPIVQAVDGQLSRGLHYGAPHVMEIAYAKKLLDCIPCAERVILCNSGNEAVHKAVTLARAYTGKDKVAKFEGGFHGSNEYSYWSITCDPERMGPVEAPRPVAGASGMPKWAAEQIVLLPFEEDHMARIVEENADELAVVLLEPALGAGGGLLVSESLAHRLRDVTERTGVLLCFDEIITGFRVARGGGQELLGVIPDIGLFGKALGGGMPIGLIATSAEIIERCLDLKPDLSVAGTFSGNVVSMTASNAFLDYVMGHPEIYAELGRKGDYLRSSFNAYARERHMPATITGIGSLWQVHLCAPPVETPRDLVREDPDLLAEFALRLRLEGVFVPAPLHIAFLSTEHSDEDVEAVLGALKNAADACFK